MLGDYFGGAVLAYCIDVRLRRDGSSLERVLAATRKQSKGDVANEQWEQQIALARLAGALVLKRARDPIDRSTAAFARGPEARHRPQLARLLVPQRALQVVALDAEPRTTT